MRSSTAGGRRIASALRAPAALAALAAVPALVLAGVGGVGGVGAVGVAAPGDDATAGTDRGFITSLQTVGITFASEDMAVLSGKTVCWLMRQGQSAPQVVEELQSRNPGLSAQDATRFIGIAANYYCPEVLTSSTAVPGTSVPGTPVPDASGPETSEPAA